LSNEPKKRLESLQTACPFKLIMLHHFVANPADDAERQLHNKYQVCQLRGEWYQLTDKQVADITQITAFKENLLKDKNVFNDIQTSY